METEEAAPEPDNEVHVVTESPNEPDSEGNDQDEQIEQWKSFNLGVRPVISIMEEQPIDFVQLTYNIDDREVEHRLLPLARDRGIGVIVNRPFQRGALTSRLEGVPLPDYAAELGARSWAQILLKFILSHPAVTVAIPATTRVAHVRENKAAARGLMPDAAMRQRMIAHFDGL